MSNSRKQKIARRAQRGSATILFTFMASMVLLPVVGLAIDGSLVLWQKARLASSVDAAAYAAGRSLSIGATVPAAQAAAQQTATTYFQANFPNGTLGSTASVTPTIPPPTNGLWTITVSATAQVPLYFLRLLGFSTSTLAAKAQVTRRNVNIIMVLDRSASLLIYNSGGCSSLVSAAQTFTNLFVAGQDNLGLITFQTTANLDFPPGTDFKSRVVTLPNGATATGMSQLIGNLQCSGYTNSVAALALAYNQIKAINQPGALNVIVFFSDGKPDAITAQFKVKQADSRDQVAYPFTYGSSAASGCSAASLTGVLVAMDENPDAAAATLGVIPAPASPTGGDPIYSQGTGTYGLTPNAISSASGCSIASGTATLNVTNGNLWCSGGSCNVRNDIESIPATDANGNSTNTSYRALTVSNSGLFPTGSYTAGYVRPDTPAGVVNSSLNAAFQQVQTIRTDTQYAPIIYSIGLGSYIDTGFMQDVANDPSAPNYSSTSPQGQYIYAPTAGQLAAAFQQIASQVLRIQQ